MKINKILSLIICAYSLCAYAQQNPSFGQYYNSFNFINPAYVGSHQTTDITTNIRSQFVGIPDGPEIQAFSIHSPTGKNIGLGFSAVHDKVFVLDETHLFADFSYTLQLSEQSKLAFGIKAGGTFLNINLVNLQITDDPLFSQNVNKFNPNIGAGAYYYTDHLFFSISTTNLLQNKRYENNSGLVTSASDNVVWYLSSGYRLDIGPDIVLKPSVLFRALKGSPLTTDISASILWANRIELGISHRIDQSIAAVSQFRLSDFMKVGYSYDKLTNNHPDFNNGSHEISLILNIGKKKNKTKAPFYF